MNINFRLGERKDTDLVYRFFSQKSLNYRGYNFWLKKAIEEYRYGIKNVIMGFCDGNLVSSLMFQNCKTLENFIELKSLRTLEEFSRRFFSSFEIRQVERLAKQERKLGIICDARSDKVNVLNMLRTNGYREVARADLYNEGYEDIVMVKPFVKRLI